jgi:hypothetical protein
LKAIPKMKPGGASIVFSSVKMTMLKRCSDRYRLSQLACAKKR